MNGEILRGFTDAIILNLLNKEDSYGYRISRSIINMTDGLMDIKDATIYLAFKRMEKERLIKSYFIDNDKNKRKYYKITDSGKRYLKDKKREWLKNKEILDLLLEI